MVNRYVLTGFLNMTCHVKNGKEKLFQNTPKGRPHTTLGPTLKQSLTHINHMVIFGLPTRPEVPKKGNLSTYFEKYSPL